MGGALGAETQHKGVDSPVRAQRRGDCLVLMLDHPPANAITTEAIQTLDLALTGAEHDASIRAIVLLGAGRGFSAGMDPSIFGTVAGAAALAHLARRIEDFAKPVIAALHGTCLGAGLELALACHWRLAAPQAQLGLPEIHLGLIPGSGGTQRLPRLVGGRQSLRLLLDGAPVGAAEALALGLVDRLAEGDLLAAAVQMAAERPIPRPTRAGTAPMTDLFGPQGALAEVRARLAGHRLPAPPRLVDCVEAAALLPFDSGLALEEAIFGDLAASDEAVGLRAAWMAERRAGVPPAAVTAAGPRGVATLGLWSPGPAETDLMVRALGAGLKLVVAAPDREALVEVLNAVAAAQDAQVADGRLTEAARDADWARLTAGLGAEVLAGCDLVLSAASGAPSGALVLGGLAAGQGGVALAPNDRAGGLAEIAMGPDADPDLAARALGLTRALGGRAVFVGPGGTVQGRLRLALGRAIAALERAGTPRDRITLALAAFGLGTGARRDLPAMPADAAPILRTCLVALAAEGGRMLDQGTALRPLDIDAAALHSGLFPRWEGGPMAWADRLGLLVLRVDLWDRAALDPDLFAVPACIDQLVSDGRRLAALNRRAG